MALLRRSPVLEVCACESLAVFAAGRKFDLCVVHIRGCLVTCIWDAGRRRHCVFHFAVVAPALQCLAFPPAWYVSAQQGFISEWLLIVEDACSFNFLAAGDAV